MNTEFTPRGLGKLVASSIIAFKTEELARKALANYTSIQTDNLIVKVGCGAVGWALSGALEPVTNKMVDKTADFTVAKYNERRNKKNTEKK